VGVAQPSLAHDRQTAAVEGCRSTMIIRKLSIPKPLLSGYQHNAKSVIIGCQLMVIQVCLIAMKYQKVLELVRKNTLVFFRRRSWM